ncbi:unnamed protein product [Rotaria socialis]|uniref:Pre-mRNA-splicing factor SYF1 n=1 Tax=Rotaria socialis TaxID=392032 RepID=A0A820FWW0_9BILA|nr:unnamed protein product [Rotaria socialis]CAF4268217.1 unnamed protein product [Rotaria socialis]CAF4517367.1 unnamed protein product [Rotaria socialis]CAF4594946.1 unnamed protein product [Rotaria socialis]
MTVEDDSSADVELSTPKLVFDETDILYEEDCLRNQYSVKAWLRYIDHIKEGPNEKINLVYERALRELPGSYKLWFSYLKLRRKQIRSKCIIDSAYEEVNNTFERSLVFMHKMPRIWLDYCQLLMDQGKITRTRRVFDRAIRALPVTQHTRIWPLYIKFVTTYPEIPDTAMRVYKRYLKLQPECVEEYINYLREIGKLDECAKLFVDMLNRDNFVSRQGKSNHQLWNELCELVSKNPTKIKSVQVEPILRQGIQKYQDQVGQLWTSLADYYIRSGCFEKARDIFEEAIESVLTVRDFTQVFDAYAQSEEGLVTALMNKPNDDDEEITEDDDLELELRLARLEYLMDRRPLMLNSVLLRQNPHNVNEWLKRVKLYGEQYDKIIQTFTTAVQTIDPKVCTGKLQDVWITFAQFYDKYQQPDEARYIYDKAVKVNFRNVDDLAAVWCAWCEMELEHERPDEAIKLMERATVLPRHKVDYYDANEAVQLRLHKSLKLWSFYVDLEECYGTFQTCRAVYDRILDLRIATPQIIINYALYLEENKYYEDGFRVYEKGIALFKWPNVYDIWLTYLCKFVARYSDGSKLERARDLFEQCLEHCPPKFAKNLYLLYAKLEEQHGLDRRALKIYERATNAVEPKEKEEMFNVYIKRCGEMQGITATREIYEKAIESLEEERAVRDMCLRYADLERKLGEIDRGRAIYSHCSQMCDPRIHNDFWQTWKEFEIKHGNEDTMREMLRIKRSVQATYNVQVNYMAAQMMAASMGDEAAANQV